MGPPIRLGCISALSCRSAERSGEGTVAGLFSFSPFPPMRMGGERVVAVLLGGVLPIYSFPICLPYRLRGSIRLKETVREGALLQPLFFPFSPLYGDSPLCVTEQQTMVFGLLVRRRCLSFYPVRELCSPRSIGS